METLVYVGLILAALALCAGVLVAAKWKKFALLWGAAAVLLVMAVWSVSPAAPWAHRAADAALLDQPAQPTKSDPLAQSDAEALDYYMAQAANAAFGGLFYEDDTLVVNVVDGAPGAAALRQYSGPQTSIEYRTVAYALKDLEAVASYLTDYMDVCAISVLDANETTNRVDVCVRDFSEENRAAVEELVRGAFPDMAGCLRFEDHTNITIQFT